ncbi:MAG: diguanylate cyclase [Chloroflexia bacterium]
MSRRAWAYIWLVFIATGAAMGVALFSFPIRTDESGTVLTFIVLATLAQLFKVEAPSNQTYYVTTIFLFAGALLLNPALFVLIVVVSYIVEWIKERVVNSPLLRKWYLQPFNICTHILAGFAAKAVYVAVAFNNQANGATAPFITLEAVVGIAASVVAYVVVNHTMIGLALVLARSVTWRESGIMDSEALLTESVLLLMGAVTAALWKINPWLVIPALSPLVLIYKTLTIPQLRHDARIDAKTGLLNAKHFSECFTAELDRARRFDRPLSLIMADLDLLRNVNNTYGHLAGDKVLTEIGRVIQSTIREYDIAGRFGGEEFAIVLPEVGMEEARHIGERLRAAVEQTIIKIATSETPIQVTMSMGLASLTPNTSTLTELLHAADVAVYQAKLQGRNRVICIVDVPHSLDLDSLGGSERRTIPTQTYQFIPSPNGAEHIGQVNVNGGISYSNGNGNGHSAAIPAPIRPVAANQTNAYSYSTAVAMQPSGVEAEGLEASLRSATGWTLPHLSPDSIHASASDAPVAESVAAPAGAASQSHAHPKEVKAPPPQIWLTLFVGVVIALGLFAVGADATYGILTGTYNFTVTDMAMIGILIVMAMLAEYFQITLYGPDTLSVSMALNFAAAPIIGVPGVAAVSLAIALVHYVRRRPALYKTAFNWATHLLAGLPAVYLITMARDTEYFSRIAVLGVATLAASAAYFVIDTGMVATAIALSSSEGNTLVVWKERYQWLAGHYIALGITGIFICVAYFAIGPISVLAFLVPIAMMRYSQKQYVDRTESSVLELKRMNAELTHANREVGLANIAIAELNEELFLSLSKIIDARDPYVGGHAAKVADYAIAIAHELRMPEHRLESLRQAGFLHDIGKIGISEQVLHKPSQLTTEEYEYVKKHAALGAEFLETCRGLRHLAPFVRHHHERWDGNGYPDRLAGEEIELEARILSVCDSAEAMASDRPYRKGMSLDEMLEEIRRCAGTQFDPNVATAFIQVVQRERDRLVTNSAQEVMMKYSESVMLSPVRTVGMPNGHKTSPDLSSVTIGKSATRSTRPI